jgi:serine/threonine-protein kinase
MFFRKKPKPPFACLFTTEDTAYELVTDLGMGQHGERLLLARPHTKGTIGGWVLVRALGKTMDKKAQRQLEHEVTLASRLDHPNIARISGLHETPEALYAVVEYVDGHSLESVITFSMMRRRNYSEAFALYVSAGIAAALAHAHTRADEKDEPLGIVHRDLSPVRIRMDTSGQVKLCEFGLASSRLQKQRATPMWRAKGDVFFASPEQLLGRPVDARSDLFSLGLVLLELTTGNHLFSEGDIKELVAMVAELSPELRQEVWTLVQQQKQTSEVSEYLAARAASFGPEDVEKAVQWLPSSLKVILHRLLCREPADRYQSAAELEADLRARLHELRKPYGAREAIAEVRDAGADARDMRDAADVAEEGVFPPAVKVRSEDEKTTEPT